MKSILPIHFGSISIFFCCYSSFGTQTAIRWNFRNRSKTQRSIISHQKITVAQGTRLKYSFHAMLKYFFFSLYIIPTNFAMSSLDMKYVFRLMAQKSHSKSTDTISKDYTRHCVAAISYLYFLVSAHIDGLHSKYFRCKSSNFTAAISNPNTAKVKTVLRV